MTALLHSLDHLRNTLRGRARRPDGEYLGPYLRLTLHPKAVITRDGRRSQLGGPGVRSGDTFTFVVRDGKVVRLSARRGKADPRDPWRGI